MTATWVLYTLHHGARQDEVGISGHYRDGIKEIYRGINADDQCDDEEKICRYGVDDGSDGGGCVGN